MLDDRKLAVLRAIVEDYVSTNEPVGSKNLVDRHNLDVSPATIRNDMAVLEELGRVCHDGFQPHLVERRELGHRQLIGHANGLGKRSMHPFKVIEIHAHPWRVDILTGGRDRHGEGAFVCHVHYVVEVLGAV